MSAVKLVCEEFFTVYIGGSQSVLPKRLLEMRITPYPGATESGSSQHSAMLQTLPVLLILAEF